MASRNKHVVDAANGVRFHVTDESENLCIIQIPGLPVFARVQRIVEQDSGLERTTYSSFIKNRNIGLARTCAEALVLVIGAFEEAKTK